MDGDGRLDVVINNADSKPTILKNVSVSAYHRLSIRLIGDPSKKSPRDAIGAIVYVSTGRLRQRQDVISGGSYGSNNDMTLHFGLGDATKIDKLEIKWPDGYLETIPLTKCDGLPFYAEEVLAKIKDVAGKSDKDAERLRAIRDFERLGVLLLPLEAHWPLDPHALDGFDTAERFHQI